MRLPELDPSRVGSSASIPETDRAGRETATASPATLGPQHDSVDLSGLAGRISGSLAPLAAGHNLRVEGLTVDYQSGNYNVQPLAVSRAIVSQALLSGALR